LIARTSPDPHLLIRRAQQRREAIELGRAGAPVPVIAKQLGMPLFVVRMALLRAKITPILTAPASTPVVSPATAVHRAPVGAGKPIRPTARRGRPPRPPLAADQADRILTTFTEYNGYDEIAAALSVPSSQVRELLMGLKPQRLAAWRTLVRMRRQLLG
jgi:hypothetical protein